MNFDCVRRCPIINRGDKYMTFGRFVLYFKYAPSRRTLSFA
jgi:hypothetical protein